MMFNLTFSCLFYLNLINPCLAQLFSGACLGLVMQAVARLKPHLVVRPGPCAAPFTTTG